MRPKLARLVYTKSLNEDHFTAETESWEEHAFIGSIWVRGWWFKLMLDQNRSVLPDPGACRRHGFW